MKLPRQPNCCFVLVILFAIVLFSCNSGEKSKPISSVTVVADTVKQKTSVAPVYETLPVNVIKTQTDADDDSSSSAGTDDSSQFPTQLKVNVEAFSGQVAVYAGAEHLLIGPANWVGLADIAPSGTRELLLSAGKNDTGEKASRVYLMEMYGASMFIGYLAAPFFSVAMKALKDESGDDGVADLKKEWSKATTNHISPKLASYTFPAKNGLVRQGVVAYDPGETTDFQSYLSVEITLPESKKELADYLARQFIVMNKLK